MRLDHERSLKVKQDNWDLTMDLISKEWIQKAIRPSDSKTCGNHVAGRKFSKNENKYQVRDLKSILIRLIQYESCCMLHKLES